MNVIERAILFSQMLLMYYTGNGTLTLNLNVQEVCSSLLSLVVYAMQESRKPFITLADFELSNDKIKREPVFLFSPAANSSLQTSRI